MRVGALGRVLAGLVTVLVVVGASSSLALAQESEGVPGDGQVVRMARPTWDTGWFQAEVMALLLAELGYSIDGPVTMENDEFYEQVALGGVDLWVNGWFPLHDNLLDAREGATRVGFEVRGGALQGYLVDRVSVERLGLESLADLADPSVAAEFDRDGDGKADLIGCNSGWACQPIVDHHIDAYGLDATVTQVSGDYGPLMADTVARFRSGEPVLFYTFTPNWTVGALVPGRDVVWLPVPFASLPADIADQEPLSVVDSVPGCLDEPCRLGFAPSDIRSVAGQGFLDDNPAIATLLEQFEISLTDISDQNARMIAGEDSAVDIINHAALWIERHRELVDEWLVSATESHLVAGLPLAPRPNSGTALAEDLGSIRVVTRLAPPFVTYEDGVYGGFSVELVELLAGDVGATADIYAVNSSAKLIDDVSRGSADIGVGAFAITSEREQLVDFTQPYFDSGLQILVSDRDEGFLGGRLGAVLNALVSRDLLLLVLVLMIVLVLAAHVIWITERRHNPEFPAEYKAGIWEALWWAAVTATTVGYGDKTPKGRSGRIFGLFWMFSGLFVLAYFTAGIATTFTLDELSSQIESPADLRGHAVAVPVDSTAADFLDRQGIAASEFDTAELAYEALLSNDVDAVVHDAAILQHFVATDTRGGTDIAGLVFAERGFGLAVATDSELAEPLNRVLLELLESGEFDDLHDKWFGNALAAGG